MEPQNKIKVPRSKAVPGAAYAPHKHRLKPSLPTETSKIFKMLFRGTKLSHTYGATEDTQRPPEKKIPGSAHVPHYHSIKPPLSPKMFKIHFCVTDHVARLWSHRKTQLTPPPEKAVPGAAHVPHKHRIRQPLSPKFYFVPPT